MKTKKNLSYGGRNGYKSFDKEPTRAGDFLKIGNGVQ